MVSLCFLLVLFPRRFCFVCVIVCSVCKCLEVFVNACCCVFAYVNHIELPCLWNVPYINKVVLPPHKAQWLLIFRNSKCCFLFRFLPACIVTVFCILFHETMTRSEHIHPSLLIRQRPSRQSVINSLSLFQARPVVSLSSLFQPRFQ